MPTVELQPDIAVDTSASCPVCPHPQHTHDAISSRYCAATAAGNRERGCVCVGDTAPVHTGSR